MNGVGFGWVLGVSGALGFGPNGGYGLSGAGTLGGGTFIGGGNQTGGTFGSAGLGFTDRGGILNYPSNQSLSSNVTFGAFGGIGGGGFLTNAGNTTSLAGPFTSYIASIGIFGFEFDCSNGTWVASTSIGKSVGLGITRIQTKTFATACR